MFAWLAGQPRPEPRPVDDAQTLLGKVDHLLETGANDVMVVKQVSGDSERPRERLIPWTGEVVSRVDVDGGNIVVDWDPDF